MNLMQVRESLILSDFDHVTMTETRPIERARPRRWAALVAYWGSISFLVMGALLIGLLAALVAPAATSATLQAFFGIAIQVDASFLLGVFVVASFLLPRLPEKDRESFSFLLTLNAGIFFIGIMSSTIGFLLPAVAITSAFNLTLVVILTWFLGLSLLVDGIRRSRNVLP